MTKSKKRVENGLTTNDPLNQVY